MFGTQGLSVGADAGPDCAQRKHPVRKLFPAAELKESRTSGIIANGTKALTIKSTPLKLIHFRIYIIGKLCNS